MSLSDEALRLLDCEHVLLMVSVEEGVLYKHLEFVDAYHAAIMDRFAALTPPGSSGRAVAFAMQRLKTSTEHQVVLKDALVRLREHGTPVDPEELREGYKVAACFPVAS